MAAAATIRSMARGVTTTWTEAPAPTRLIGGAGNDAVSYSGPAGVTVSLDGQRNDGAAGEADNVGADVEAVYGGSGADTLLGSRRAETLDGGPGNDRLVGNRGVDGLYGGAGDDVIDAADGAIDIVDCGPGTDEVTADGNDDVENCEGGARVRVVVNDGYSPKPGDKAASCRGRATIRIQQAGRRIASKTVRVDGNCRIRATFRIAASKIDTSKRLVLVVRFLGNSVFSADTFPPRTCRRGGRQCAIE